MIAMRLALKIFALGCVLAGITARAEEPPRLRIVVSDNIGTVIAPERVRFQIGAEWKLLPFGQTITLPAGDYHVEIMVRGFGFTDAAFSLQSSVPTVIDIPGYNAIDDSKPARLLMVALRSGTVEGPSLSCSIRGDISGNATVTRMRLMEAHGSYVTDIVVRNGGSYAFENVACGDYILMVFGTQGCLAARTMRSLPFHQYLDWKLKEDGLSNGCPLPDVVPVRSAQPAEKRESTPGPVK